MKRLFLTAIIMLVPTMGFCQNSWWQPVIAGEFQWELDHALNTNNVGDMGTGKIAWNGDSAPATNPVVYDIDGLDYGDMTNTVAALHAMSYNGVTFKVICYIEVGAVDTYSPDIAAFRAITPSVIGKTMSGYSSENYIDIRNPSVVALIKARIAKCAAQKFDAIEPDIDEEYGNGSSAVGFPLTKANEETFMKVLAAYAHSLGLAMLGKNMDDTGDSYAADMEPYIDAQLTEQCNQYNTCNLLNSYTGHKAVWNVEYKGQTKVGKFCPKDNVRAGWMGTFMGVNLMGLPRMPCK